MQIDVLRKNRAADLQRYGRGLGFKLAFFTIVLVIVLIVMISLPLFHVMVKTERETLLKGLWDRCTVLLDGIANNARIYLPMGNTMELSLLPAHADAVPEARYITITGMQPGSHVYEDRVWASNDPDIFYKIDTPELAPGISRLSDAISPRLEKMQSDLNEEAETLIGELSRNIYDLTREALVLSQNPHRNSQGQFADIELAIRSSETVINMTFLEMTRIPGSEPEFAFGSLSEGNRNFLFFKPILGRHGLSDNYFIGLIRLEVSVDSIADHLKNAEFRLLQTILFVALAALAMGIIGAFAVSSALIRPVRKLARHVEMIRGTEDMEELAGVSIPVVGRDEIALLGDTINEMTQGLAEAAAAASDLSIGREIQKKFLPLDLDQNGNKLNCGYREDKNAVFFGYYEGAKGISGDYFDYRKLDDRYYAIIKCDVAGKGIPAALIMIQVATMFLNYIKNWKPSGEIHIEEVVYQINDFIEAMGFRERFAAFTLCLFDSETGTLHFCNAGDNRIHICDNSAKYLKTIILPSTPAAGALPHSMVESKGGYRMQTVALNHGDILLLFSDGIEEAKRSFRDSLFNEIACTAGDAGTPHGSHFAGESGEEMGTERVNEIINAVLNRTQYSLFKSHNPEGEQDIIFDYSSCDGRVDEVIMALVAAEKMFSCYKDRRASGNDCVPVDKKIDLFLRKHFLQYLTYCINTRECLGNDAYMYYTHLREDKQYDDLSILGIKRK